MIDKKRKNILKSTGQGKRRGGRGIVNSKHRVKNNYELRKEKIN